MRSSIIIFLTLILFRQPCYCQTKARITDVDFHLEDRYIVVNYNIAGSLPKEQMTIELKFITENNESIIPKTITGDVGTKVFADGMKAILWNIVADQVLLAGNLKASVAITSSKILYAGPSNAFLSILIPGLGGYFADEKKGRAVLTTISTLGFMGYGLIQRNQSDDYYREYNVSTDPSDIQDYYDKANDAHHKYLTSVRIGAGIWVFDVVWVFFKGIHNRNKAKSAYSVFSDDGFNLYYVNNELHVGYKVTF